MLLRVNVGKLVSLAQETRFFDALSTKKQILKQHTTLPNPSSPFRYNEATSLQILCSQIAHSRHVEDSAG
jgi:hypothetical protein